MQCLFGQFVGRSFGLLDLRTIGHPDYWASGISYLQTIGLSDYRTFGLSDLRTIGPSDYWDFGLFGRHHYMLGNMKYNIILRLQCSSLGVDLFKENIINDSSYPFGCPLEDAFHYLLECPIYTNTIMYEYYTLYCYLN